MEMLPDTIGVRHVIIISEKIFRKKSRGYIKASEDVSYPHIKKGPFGGGQKGPFVPLFRIENQKLNLTPILNTLGLRILRSCPKSSAVILSSFFNA